MKTVEKREEKTFAGSDIRAVLGDDLANKIGIAEGMTFNRSALMLFLRRMTTLDDIRSIVLVDRYNDDVKGTIRSFHDAPNLAMKDIHGVTHFFRVRAREELTWANTWPSKIALLKCLFEIAIEFIADAKGLDIESDPIRREVSGHVLLPDYGFEYNFTTGRFNIKLPGGYVIRKVKQSAYPDYCKGIKVALHIGRNSQYGWIGAPGTIDLVEWLPTDMQERQLILDRVAHMVEDEIHSAGWHASVKVTTNEQLFAGKIVEYEQPRKTLSILLDPDDPQPERTLTMITSELNRQQP